MWAYTNEFPLFQIITGSKYPLCNAKIPFLKSISGAFQ